MTTSDDIRITFLGGADEIGASSALVSVAGTELLVDCGVRFEAGRALPDLAELSGRRLDAILVTHAHSDHTGGLPVAHEAFPATPIYATPPTAALVRILQRDALRLMAEGWKREGEIPLYGEAAVESMLEVVVGVKFAETFAVGEVEVTFLPASHILGASMIHLATPAGNVLFTGDYSVEAQRTVPALDRPPLPADLVVTESTYGERLHADRKAAERRLVERVAATLTGGGAVLVPAFAIGRAQEVILILRRALESGELPAVPVFVDGMVRAVCEAYRSFPTFVTSSLAKRIRRSHPFYADTIRPVADAAERRAVLDAGPAVIVASSGMLAGGASAFYAAGMAPRERDAILVTGYQDEESPGRRLLRLAEGEGPRVLTLDGREVPVRCSFGSYGLSAHADRMQMAGLVESLAPRTVVLVHGDAAAKRNLAGSLSCSDVVLAGNGSVVTRSYPARRRAGPRRPSPLELDEDRARQLLANAPGGAVRVSRLADAWFGRKAAPILVERLVRRLEELGVAVRDDRRRGLLRILAVDPEEERLAAELREENPKGRLLEYCARLSVEPPAFATAEIGGGRHRAEFRLEVDGRTVGSGPREAGSARVAEQLAARALLEEIGRLDDADGAWEVDEAEAERLREENPKGRLLERCMAARIEPPEFLVRPLARGGFAGSARVVAVSGREVSSASYRAPAAKTVEQAAARDLLGRLEEEPAAPAEGPGEAAATPARPDARLMLNRYRQTGQIEDFGYELVQQRGPAHRPEFVVRCVVRLRGGGAVESDPVAASTRKAAEREAAAGALARLEG